MLKSVSVQDWLDALAAQTATPGGGGAAALMGAMGAALVSMVCRLTIDKGAEGEHGRRLRATLEEAEKLRGVLTGLIDDDRAAYDRVMRGYQLPKATQHEKDHRSAVIQQALLQATLVPMRCARSAAAVLGLVVTVAEEGQPSALGESGVAAESAAAALRASALNVSINLGSIRDQNFIGEQLAALKSIQDSCRGNSDRIHALLERRLGRAQSAQQGTASQGGHSIGHP